VFVGDPQRHLTGDEQAHVRCATMQRLDHGSGGLLVDTPSALPMTPGTAPGSLVAEVDQAHAMAMQLALPEQQRLGEPRLADATGTRDADQAMLADQRGECRDIAARPVSGERTGGRFVFSVAGTRCAVVGSAAGNAAGGGASTFATKR
jgi:hypothetical protein